MQYTRFLYSRSITKDYRWMIVPPEIDISKLQVLSALYNAFDQYKSKKVFSNAPVQPLYLLNNGNRIFIVRTSATNQFDEYGRVIYAMQGISISGESVYELRFGLPYLLKDHEKYFDILSEFSPYDADKLSFTPSEIKGVNFAISSNSIIEKFGVPLPMHFPTVEKKYLSYDENGFRDLMLYFLSPYVPLSEFAFGAVPEALKLLPQLKIIAPAYQM